jgi:hypothetical protein
MVPVKSGRMRTNIFGLPDRPGGYFSKTFYHPFPGSSGTTRYFVHPVFPVQQFMKTSQGGHDYYWDLMKKALKKDTQ